ncbi:PLP-dependent aminotransferase family protein [Salinicola endophyticus]|uniref:PLP-dependent aminotransferase family protein n=1 Tax=Salinicola endophyticus TaxID=1949083 RepID=A0ABY8FFR1_9GAMM|nr:PLP-dependent aminotransferase family protein [Salinicola endophyticus]WFF41497.1 PLP-dependent aminotransferase family protein [Salinicola endophyticus]
MSNPRLRLDRAQNVPIYRQLYQRLREAMTDGRLPAGKRVPSVRSLASELNLSRGTVELAYQLLVSEGYLLPRGPAGTIVSPHLPDATGPAPIPDTMAGQAPESDLEPPLPFQLGLPALDAFPHKLWARLTQRRLRAQSSAELNYPPPTGHPALKRALVSYLGVSRGIACQPEQIFITDSYRDTLGLICRALLTPGDRGWFEEPGYVMARERLQGEGMQLTPVSVDAEGLNVETGCSRAAQARFAVVTPTHQSPTGVTLTLARRRALLAWAKREAAWIIEDDYDSEYRYRGQPEAALKSLDGDERVLYTGTFSKVLFPAIKLAYLVVPSAQVATFRRAMQHLGHGAPTLSQAVVTDFIEEGHFARHLKRMRALYQVRREHLRQALEHHLGDRIHLDLQAGGMHLLARLPDGADDVSLANRAASAGLGGHALSAWYLSSARHSGLLLSFTNVIDAAHADALAARLAELMV